MSYTFEVVDGHLTNVSYVSYDGDDYFNCESRRLTSLKGCPKVVKGDFSCSENYLTTLKGCPKEVNGGFFCYFNKLTTLKGCPKVINGNFVCFENQLTTLEGSPKEVNGIFNCQSNKLTTLEGGPEVVYEDFDCSYNNLTTLKGCPKVIYGEFDCKGNSNLEDISDLSESVDELVIEDCPNIKIFPKHIKDTLEIRDIPKEVYERLKQQPHLEIVEDNENYIIIKEKSLGNQLLEAI